MMQSITQWILEGLRSHGGTAVFMGVIIESIIVPIPSPLIIMGAGAALIPPDLPALGVFWAIIFRIVLPGATASVLGSFFAYGIAYAGGKPAIDRFHRFLGFTWEDLMAIERHMAGRVPLMIFLLRAAPIVPLSLISAVGGVVRLPVWQFGLWTFLGALPRCLLLAYLGFLLRDTYQGLAGRLNHIESLASGVIVAGTVALILWARAAMRRRIAPEESKVK
jgi:membrane protein DedA with SNARE-associated domain